MEIIIQLNGNTTMVDSNTQISYIEHFKINVNQEAKLNDGAKKNILTSRHPNREATMLVSEINLTIFENQLNEIRS
jgi:hypothetical protein